MSYNCEFCSLPTPPKQPLLTVTETVVYNSGPYNHVRKICKRCKDLLSDGGPEYLQGNIRSLRHMMGKAIAAADRQYVKTHHDRNLAQLKVKDANPAQVATYVEEQVALATAKIEDHDAAQDKLRQLFGTPDPFAPMRQPDSADKGKPTERKTGKVRTAASLQTTNKLHPPRPADISPPKKLPSRARGEKPCQKNHPASNPSNNDS